MNKNLIIAILVLAGGAWYYFGSSGKAADFSAKAGVMSPAGVYTDQANGFAVTFPPGWKEVPAAHISAKNGYKFFLPEYAAGALVVIPPGQHKAATMLIKARREPAGLKPLALQVLQSIGAMKKADLGVEASGPEYREFPATAGEPHRISGQAVLDDSTLAHYCFFAGKQNVFSLYTVAEPGYPAGLLGELDAIAASLRRI